MNLLHRSTAVLLVGAVAFVRLVAVVAVAAPGAGCCAPPPLPQPYHPLFFAAVLSCAACAAATFPAPGPVAAVGAEPGTVAIGST